MNQEKIIDVHQSGVHCAWQCAPDGPMRAQKAEDFYFRNQTVTLSAWALNKFYNTGAATAAKKRIKAFTVVTPANRL